MTLGAYLVSLVLAFLVGFFFEAAIGKESLKLVGHQEEVRCLAFTSDGKTLLYSGGRTTWLCDVATGKERRTLRGECAAFAPDGKTVVNRERHDGCVHVWDAGEPENAERGSRKAEQMGDLQVCLFRVPRSAFRVS